MSEEMKNAKNFAGIPVAVDDNILIKNQLSAAGSKMLYNFKPPFGATVVDKITEAGMDIVERTPSSEFGIGVSSSNAVESVAAGSVKYAFCSDSNGSIRHVAAENGVCFIKPTYGTVSRFGLVANVSSMECIGVVSKNIEDGFAALSVIAGDDEKDGTTYPTKEYEYISEQEDLKSVKIGVPADYLKCACEDDLENINEFINQLESLGASVEKFDFPLAEVVPHVNYIISSAEASNNISRFDGVKFGYRTDNFRGINDLIVNSRSEAFCFETKLMALTGGSVLSQEHYEGYYLKALKIRRLIKERLEESFAKYDCILLPARGNAENKNKALNDGFFNFYNDSKFTALANLAGFPAVSMPCGVNGNGSPVGVQLMAKTFGENKLLTIGKCYQNSKF